MVNKIIMHGIFLCEVKNYTIRQAYYVYLVNVKLEVLLSLDSSECKEHIILTDIEPDSRVNGHTSLVH